MLLTETGKQNNNKMKTYKTILIVVFVIAIILLIPLIPKNNNRVAFNAPGIENVEYSEIFFINKTESIKLAAMLFLPQGEGPFPSAVVIQGSGPSSRENGWYLAVAKHLQDNGIAVLLPDKRGCEKSEGNWIGSDFNELADDALAAVDYLKRQNNFECSHIGLIGMSQGGWIAPVAAQKSDKIKFVVSMSGATVTTQEQLRYEEIHNISEFTYPFIARLIAPVSSKKIEKRDYYKGLLGFDPLPYLQKIQIPTFFAFGGGDKNVPVESCINRIIDNNLDTIQYKVYPNGGHGIIHPENGKIYDEFLQDLTRFIKNINK